MNRALWIGLVLACCGACYGALLHNGKAASSQQAAATPQGDSWTPIQKQRVVPLPPVRAPAGVGEAAMDHVRAIVAFGPRHPGAPPAPGWTQQIEYIAAELQRQGLQLQRDTWTDRKERITFTNLAARIAGRRDERIVLACHHDTKCTQGHADPRHNFHFVGANDGASAVGLLLALIPTLKARSNEATIELVFFDGEESLDWAWNDGERALFGSRRYVQRHRDAELRGDSPRIAAVIVLDMVGRKDLHIQEELHSTVALRELVYAAALGCGHERHFFQRAEAASDDHKPFLDVGIPAVDLIDLNGNPYWHTKDDTVENMSSHSLQIVADVVLTLLPAVEAKYLDKRD